MGYRIKKIFFASNPTIFMLYIFKVKVNKK